MRSRHDTITITSPQRRHHHPTLSGIEYNNRIVCFRAMERATWPKRGTFHSEDYNRKPSDGLMMMNWNLSKYTHLKYDDVPFLYFNCILHRKKTKREKMCNTMDPNGNKRDSKMQSKQNMHTLGTHPIVPRDDTVFVSLSVFGIPKLFTRSCTPMHSCHCHSNSQSRSSH